MTIDVRYNDYICSLYTQCVSTRNGITLYKESVYQIFKKFQIVCGYRKLT
jgi:hypothetical protein